MPVIETDEFYTVASSIHQNEAAGEQERPSRHKEATLAALRF